MKVFENGDYGSVTDRIIHMLFQIDDVIHFGQQSIGVRLEDLKENLGEPWLHCVN